MANDKRTPIGSYRLAAPIVEVEQTPQSLPPGHVALRGHGWAARVPAAVLLALASAVGARMLPTPAAADPSAERAFIQLERMALEDERFRRELRQELESLRSRLDMLETRISLLQQSQR